MVGRYLVGWTVTAVLVAANVLAAPVDLPFAVGNRNPLVQIHALPGLGSGSLLPAGAVGGLVSLEVANSYSSDFNSDDAIELDGELYRLDLGAAIGLGDGFEVGVALPFIQHSGGSLDGFVEAYTPPEPDEFPTRRTQGGVTVWDRSAALDGVTLLGMRRNNEMVAVVVDMEGRELHRWALPYSAVWPEAPHIIRQAPDSQISWHGMHLFANGDLLFNFQGGNFPGVLTRSKPVRSLDDLKGLRLRTQSETIDVLRRLGADPVDMPMGEVYPALAKGVIDGVVAPVDTLRALHFAEVASYFTELHISRGSYPARAISARVWAALPDDLRSILTGSQAVWERALMDEVLKGQEAGYLFGREHGVEFIAVSAEDQRRFDEVSRQSAVDRAGSLRAYGIDGDAILFRVHSLIRRRAEGYAMTCHDDAHEGVLQ